MVRKGLGQGVAYTLLSILLIITLLPVALLLFLSVRSNLDIIMDFWAWPETIKWDNYTRAFEGIKDSILNTLFITAVSVTLGLLFGSFAGYSFARNRFPGKKILYMLLLTIIMIPGVLTLVPSYGLVVWLQLTDSFWGLILTYVAGAQVLIIVLVRNYVESIPEELFEAARIDGGSEWYLYSRIAMPLAIPTLVSLGVLNFLAIYNDYIWPLLLLSQAKQTFAIAVVSLTTNGRADLGLTFAANVIGSIPLAIVMMLGMRYYVQGQLSGAIKN